MSNNNVETLNIFHLDQNREFSEDEAYQLVNMLHIVTQKSKNKINSYSGQTQFHSRNPKEAEVYQAKLNEEIQKWSEKTRRLGAIPLSLYKVKITAKGGGYYTWEFPSSELEWKS
ncbi:MAG: hypothetical protein KC478_00090 [Bacteriovoracaceae bacterium]|nr:hypothetical protein [Bacteriovoracaceae bacterium]